MRVSIRYAAIAALIAAAPAQAQLHKCTAADGGVTLQQTPCPPRRDAAIPPPSPATNPPSTLAPSLAELTVRCSKLPKESTAYHTCAAQLSCAEAGNQGPAYASCVDKLTEGRRRADAASEASAQQARARARAAQPVPSSAVDCTSLYSYARAKGHSWMEAVAIAKEAEDSGRCQKTK